MIDAFFIIGIIALWAIILGLGGLIAYLCGLED